jgi:hypothetical protein
LFKINRLYILSKSASNKITTSSGNSDNKLVLVDSIFYI